MSIRNFVPELWSAKIFQELDKSHVLVPLCNRDYEGEISNYGDTVRINAIGDITIQNYAPNVTSITPQQLSGAQTVLEIDKAKYFAFYIDDVDNAQSKPKLMGEAMRKAAYALGDNSDQEVAGLHTQAGATVASTACTVALALTVLSRTAKTLDEKNVPSQGRWMAVPPWFHHLLVLNKILETEGSVVADPQYTNGFIGRAYGFDMYVSNNLSTGPKTLFHESHYALAGTKRAITWADQVVKTEAYRPENSFSDAVKGLHVYGRKVIDPNALVRLNIASTSTV